MFIYLLPYLFIYEVFSAINIQDKGIAPIENSSVGIQFFINIENTYRRRSCKISIHPERCCLNYSGMIPDCDSMEVFPDYKEAVRSQDLETMTQVYPTMYPYDQVGFCNFIIEAHCDRAKKRSTQIIYIPFDTRITTDTNERGTFSKHMKINSALDCSSLDEDSFNDCSPVNCNLKYGGAKPYFDERVRRCVAAANCTGDPSKDLPDTAYVPDSNTCRDLESPLTAKDVYDITSNLFITSLPKAEYDKKKIEIKSNCSTISQNLQLIRDLLLGKLCVGMDQDVSSYSVCLRTAILHIFIIILGVCAALLTFVFCVHMCVYLRGKRQTDEKKSNSSEYRRQFTGQGNVRRGNKGDTGTDKDSIVNPKVKNALLRDVIVRDIPLELRDTAVDICDRMGKEVRWKKRYRSGDSNQVNFTVEHHPSASDTDEDLESDETQKLLDK